MIISPVHKTQKNVGYLNVRYANDKSCTGEKPSVKTSISNQNYRAGVDLRTNSAKKSTKPNVTVIDNSNARGISSELNKRGVNAIGYVFGGMSSDGIIDRLVSCKGTRGASHIVLHTGDIEVSNNPKNAVTAATNVINKALEVFSDHRILINTIPESDVADSLRETIKTVNHAIITKCSIVPELTLVDYKKLRLKDSIYFTAGSVSEVSTIDHINNKYF